MDLFYLACDIVTRCTAICVLLWFAIWLSGHVIIDVLLPKWDRRQQRRQIEELSGPVGVLMDEMRRKDIEINLMRTLLRDAKLMSEQCLHTADEFEDLLIFLMNQERTRQDQDPLDILFVGEAIDEIRTRMGRAKKEEGPRRQRAEDLVIEAGILCHFVEQVKNEQGIEPPPAFYKLQQMLRDIKPRPDPRKKS